MQITHVRTPEDAQGLSERLSTAGSVAVDCEAAGYHRYSDEICLIQLSIPDHTFILDPLSFDPAPVLRPVLEDPVRVILMHGADYDIRLLDRDLGIQVRGLFDTQAAASLCGEPAIGLSSLLERHLGVKLSKKYQKADWARRPLSEGMIRYAAADTGHLHDLADRLETQLEELGRLHWAQEEFRRLEAIRWEQPEAVDPVTRVKGARDLTPRQVAALRAALDWRDEIGREKDRALFRVVSDGVLVSVVQDPPTSVSELADRRGMSGRLAREHGADLLRRLRAADSLPEGELEGYPPPIRSGNGRPPPEVEARFDELKRLRNHAAERLGLERGRLIANAILMEIATRSPETVEALRAVPDLRSWQVEALGDELLNIVRRSQDRGTVSPR